MSVELSQLLQLLAGQRSVLTIGCVPRAAAAVLELNPGVVYLGSKEARHIFESHNDIAGEDLMLMTFAVEQGTYYKDPKRPDCVSVIYESCTSGKQLLLALKKVGFGEMWVSTYHRTNPKKVRQRQGKWSVIFKPAKR